VAPQLLISEKENASLKQKMRKIKRKVKQKLYNLPFVIIKL